MRSASPVKRAAQVVALALVSCSVALAQQGGRATAENVARLDNVDGSVLVGTASGLVSGTAGMALQEGTRVLTTARGKVTVRFDDGCDVSLEPNQRFVVSRDRPCELRILTVQATVPAPVAPPASPVASAALSGNLETAAFIGAVGLGVALWNRPEDSVSPN